MKRSRHPQTRHRDEDVVVYRDLPAKQSGDHRWVAIAMYVLTEGQARAVGLPCPPLQRSQLVAVTVCCADCEGAVDDVAGSPCDAPDVLEATGS